MNAVKPNMIILNLKMAVLGFALLTPTYVNRTYHYLGFCGFVGWGERSEAQHDHFKFKDGCVGLRVAHPNPR